MSQRAGTLNKHEIKLIANYYSSLKCIFSQIKTKKSQTMPSKAKRCVFCHGSTGKTPYTIYPNIGGQKKNYLSRQLFAMRESAINVIQHAKKEARFHRIMAPSMLDLTDKEIDDISEYFSQQRCR